MLQNIWWKINRSIKKECNIQIFPLIFDPACLLSTRLLHSLNRSHVRGNFPPENNNNSLPWLLFPYFFYEWYPLDVHSISHMFSLYSTCCSNGLNIILSQSAYLPICLSAYRFAGKKYLNIQTGSGADDRTGFISRKNCFKNRSIFLMTLSL